MSAAVEQSLQREQLFPPARIIYSARGSDQITDLVNDIAKGGIVAEAVDESDSAASSKQPAAVGPEPDESQVKLRTDTARSILDRLWIITRIVRGGGRWFSGQREAWRRAWSSSVFSPITHGMAAEIADKLDTPGAELELSRTEGQLTRKAKAEVTVDASNRLNTANRGRNRTGPGA